jgi:hypothetical protein
VRDEEEGASRAECGVAVADGGASLRCGELEIGDQAHVVRRLRGPGGGVRADPLDVEAVGEDPALVESGLREVHGGHPPALPREPDRVASLPGGQVEGASGWQVGQLGLDELVGPR